MDRDFVARWGHGPLISWKTLLFRFITQKYISDGVYSKHQGKAFGTNKDVAKGDLRRTSS
jgi:hypothetical protein